MGSINRRRCYLMAVYPSLTKAYAQAIFIDGTKRFSEIKEEYVEPLKQHAAANYTKSQIDKALANGWITQVEYDETLAYKYPDGIIPTAEEETLDA
jgi:hypothetical protein